MSRKAISEKIKKAVREKCYYGCVICGSPIVEYEHIEEWHAVHEHKEENITLLCPTHHAEVTKKIIDKEYVKKMTLNPFNKAHQFTPKHQLYFSGNEFKVILGTSVSEEKMFTEQSRVILKMMGRHIISARFENENLLLSLVLPDRNGVPIFLILDNELIMNTKGYDIIIVSNRFIVKYNSISLLELEIKTPHTLKINTLILTLNGTKLDVKDGVINYGRNKIIGGNSSYNGGAAFNFN